MTENENTASQRDITMASVGTAGIRHLLHLLHSEGVAKWRLAAESLSLAACADPAKLAGIYPRKGTLRIGADADVVILDPNTTHEAEGTDGGAGHHDPYAGINIMGEIAAVFRSGVQVRGRGAVDASRVPPGQYLDRRVSLG